MRRPKLYTVDEAARLLVLAPKTVRNLLSKHRDQFSHHRRGRRRLLTQDDVDRLDALIPIRLK